jgi:hypothetical protein
MAAFRRYELVFGFLLGLGLCVVGTVYNKYNYGDGQPARNNKSDNVKVSAEGRAQDGTSVATCHYPMGWKPTEQELHRILSDHQEWIKNLPASQSDRRANLCNANLKSVELNDANLYGVELNNANLSFAKLNRAKLKFAKLNDANLFGAELNNADLSLAELNKAILHNAKLNHADLFLTKLNNAGLYEAELNNANLFEAELNKADLLRSSVASAVLAYADLTGARYAPRSLAPDSYVAGIRGLSAVTFPPGQEIGLVQLRDLLQKAGLRELEREATFSIEHRKTMTSIYGALGYQPGAAERAEAVFRYIAFDLTAAYGLRPGRALLLIATLWALLIPIYAWPIRQSQRPPTASSIYRIWPKERVEVRKDEPTLDDPARVERLHGRGLAAIGWAAYFSLLSAFQIGFREFSVGAWLSRTQPRNFALEATGWVRTVAGFQSLLSVYLLAMWLLTYFGRPFQ